ncbi:histone-fold-containing protein [Lobosporangium transversale]|uniref:Histone-fold-containing protein n=1 Tax=Lobosporangium transversale TaxID=64571 RepID=A0A1Y2GN52_9FUNG|nr:histone-fold-containing protein [Lobosporangium transversale]ORZ12168.1 histone-fold-containing protein [Lobosporangium transversale]|eukprot:XP_021880033.1 histone-fold-containing protein [Lobosporangium transversale]
MRKKYKTKFPARIKKIMQMDEDVGKVAQATPILISKALELFMQSLIDEACIEARSKNAKRLTAAHLKTTILEKDQFDFLRDIVQNVADPSGSKGSGNDDMNNNEPTSSSNSGVGGSTSRSHSRSNSMKMEEDDDKSFADFAGAMAAARSGAPIRKSSAKSIKQEDDDDYDNE